MSEASKDPAIKLFGKTIPLLDIPPAAAAAAPPPVDSAEDCRNSSNSTPEDDDPAVFAKDEETPEEVEASRANLTDAKVEDGVQPSLEDSTNPHMSSVFKENLKTPSTDIEATNLKTAKADEEHCDSCNSQEKTLKKPDKILPCPRCNSMDTKFCYYNNYNVTQPRHFCKNCQRYWTAGGTMRNVPVGAGRRKNKNSASHYRHITVSEALHSARREVPNGIHYPSQKPNGAVLTFGSETPLSESMASVLNTAEKTIPNCSINGFHKPELRLPVPCGSGDNGDSNSSGSSVTAANSMDEISKTGLQNPVMQNCHRYPPPVPCFPGASWPYLWNSAHPVPPSAFCAPSFPMPFYPVAPYWGCTVPGTWNVPWVAPPPCSPMPPTLGKHSRDENELKSLTSGEEGLPKENKAEKCLWVPKTLRIDDPGEAAKSSIWATLGIKNDNSDLFKGFQSKDDSKNHSSGTPPVLQANPAALSRSLNFQESS